MGSIQKTFPAPPNTSGRSRPKLLWINCRLLHPLIGGDRLRTYHMLRLLKQDFEITYLCPTTPDDSPDAAGKAGEYCDHLIAVPHRFSRRGSLEFVWGALKNSLWGELPYMAQRYVSPGISSWITQNAGGHSFDLIVSDYLVSWVHLKHLQTPPHTPVVAFQHNVESLIWRRHAAAAKNPLKRWIFQRETQLTEKMESDCAASVAGQVTVSPDETQYFQGERGMPNVLGDVPTGVDAEYFQPSAQPNPHTVAFLGSMDWEANCQAVRTFLRECFPAIRAEFPDAKFLIIGRNPPTDLKELASQDSSIVVTGTVPDVRPHLAQASVMILPLQVGGGTRIKVFEALAAGLAVVSTSVGVEGLPVTHGEQALIVDTMPAFTEATLSLLRQPEHARKLGQEGRRLVEENFSWQAASQKFKMLCEPLTRQQSQPIAAQIQR
ncbi:glycosyltransferase family 4 protein [Verrucomicrobium sp. BvORR106]|uniref:glycosyltransferase family 4 protein n=1 Tax=Verrucomicrobium sp. BvORR106 TaxID=1403819 RepID=UPI00056E342F|nr:glycosyltransferase family 4 protein [Verrucomicrobium sp. BvORR106]